MSQQLELLTENLSQWNTVIYVTPEIQKKEIKPFVVLALKELEGNPDSRTSSLMNADKFAAIRAIVRHMARLRSASKAPWDHNEVRSFVEGLRFGLPIYQRKLYAIIHPDIRSAAGAMREKPEFSPECTLELTSLLCTEKIYENMPTHLRVKPGLVSLSWKIDLSMSQANIASEQASPQRSKELLRRDTHIVLSIITTLGQTLTYRLSLHKFHELRFAVAGALKNIIVLERRNCMKRD